MYELNKVIVIGDIILDQYYNGYVTKLSPEAPVPVIKMKDSFEVLGGAANVANNLISLGCQTALIGTIGIDIYGQSIIKILQNSKIDISALNVREGYKTITKTRIIGNKQQIVRLDYNDDKKPLKVETESLVNGLYKIIDEYDVVVISDYNKGTCTSQLCIEIISECKRRNKIIIVDPKGMNWNKYSGANIITPNIREISEYLSFPIQNSDEDIKKNCRSIYDSININNILITRAEKGMTLINRKNKPVNFPSKVKEVYDVTGAGDTVVAALAAFIKNDIQFDDEINIANIAAGIVAEKRGTAVVTLKEIQSKMKINYINKIANKIVGADELMIEVKKWKESGESIAFTNGCYDIFHKGHVFSIYSAAEFCNHLIVAINSDKSVKKLKGPKRPINNQNDRAYIIAALSCVDAVIIFDEDTPKRLLSIIRPNVLVKGGDYKIEEVIGREYAGKVEIIEYLQSYSTTNIIKKMNNI